MHSTTLAMPQTSSDPRDPWGIVDSPFLSIRAKRKRLKDWLRDEQALLVADDDGMDGGPPSRLEEVAHALRAVEMRRSA